MSTAFPSRHRSQESGSVHQKTHVVSSSPGIRAVTSSQVDKVPLVTSPRLSQGVIIRDKVAAERVTERADVLFLGHPCYWCLYARGTARRRRGTGDVCFEGRCNGRADTSEPLEANCKSYLRWFNVQLSAPTVGFLLLSMARCKQQKGLESMSDGVSHSRL